MCKTRKVTAGPGPESRTVRMKAIGNNGEGKIGKIPCLNGFNAEVRLITPAEDEDDWAGTGIAIAADQIPLDQIYNKIDSLQNKDDPSAMVYGLYPNSDWPCNVKKTFYNSDIPHDDVLTIHYNKQDQTVTFACSTFLFQ